MSPRQRRRLIRPSRGLRKMLDFILVLSQSQWALRRDLHLIMMRPSGLTHHVYKLSLSALAINILLSSVLRSCCLALVRNRCKVKYQKVGSRTKLNGDNELNEVT